MFGNRENILNQRLVGIAKALHEIHQIGILLELYKVKFPHKLFVQVLGDGSLCFLRSAPVFEASVATFVI